MILSFKILGCTPSVSACALRRPLGHELPSRSVVLAGITEGTVWLPFRRDRQRSCRERRCGI
jgi:hypothetical protein